MSTERTHHKYSPSQLQSLEACPCYESRQTQHARAIAGTIAHAASETGEDDNRLSDDDAVAVAECRDFLERRKQLLEEARQRTVLATPDKKKKKVPAIIQLNETYLPVDDCKFPDGSESTTAGFIDWALIDSTRTLAELGDFKFGAWRVEKAELNLQGIAYALGLFKAYPTLKQIRVFFIQPHVPLISEAVFTRDQVPALYLRVQTVVARARASRESKSFDSANPTNPGCLFCANIGKCPKVLDFACKVGAKFYPLDLPADITPTKVLAPDQTALALRLAAVLKTWADAFRAQVTDRVLRRDAELPDGYILGSSSRRQLIDQTKFREIALQYLTEEEYAATLSVEFGSVETQIQNKAPRGSKKAQLEAFQDRLENAGAVKRGDPYPFLKVSPGKSE